MHGQDGRQVGSDFDLNSVDERDTLGLAAPFQRPPRPGMVDQSLPDQPRRQGKELMTALEAAHLAPNQSQVGLVDQCRGLKRMADAFPLKMVGGETT